ncbi:hypothetical protein [Pyrobaculum aerophilum]|uniref:hypothetical protein n=1 Tax=Pyrobaculum aerophilum TaxID=13773 RepID=UPI0023F3A50E|nr:hypothetical protein [Pyrobaculum aerophilum]MCX8135702.1 hypothetical protein [Pyrobaculum aerophilum]
MERRRLIRIRGSYLVYLPKKVAALYETPDVVVYWEGRFVGVTPPARRRYACNISAPQIVVAGYAAGLDELYIPKNGGAARGLEKVYAEWTEEGGLLKIRYIDKYADKSEVVERMLKIALYLLEGLEKGTATKKTVEAADDETDLLRLTVNRLCARQPTPKCAFYIQLARYYERAVDHIRELYAESHTPELWRLLYNTARELAKIHNRRNVEDTVKFLSTIPSRRFAVMQTARSELAMLHAVRVVDYFENAAEVYLDLTLYDNAEITAEEAARHSAEMR